MDKDRYLKPFFVDDWEPEKQNCVSITKQDKEEVFEDLCKSIKKSFEKEWSQNQSTISDSIQLEKEAIIGKDMAVTTFKNKISDYLRIHDCYDNWHPLWYENIVDAVFQENWGMAGLSEFFSEKYKDLPSAKVIGDRVYFLIDGVATLMPQKIPTVRRQQLVKALCMDNPRERFDKDLHNIYINTDKGNERVTIYNESMTKKDQDTIIIRRYIVPNYTLEEQINRGTIPFELAPLLESMTMLGYNIAITGPIRTAKTTLLACLLGLPQYPPLEGQKREDVNKSVESVLLETDPEIDMTKVSPDAPIIQIVADGERLSGKEAGVGGIVKSLMRSDAAILTVGEARDGLSLDTVVSLANKGSKRCKMTFHTKNPEEFCSDVAGEIIKYTKSDLNFTETKVAKSFDYVIHMVSLRDKSKKRVKAIYDISYDYKTKEIKVVPICRYKFNTDSWEFNYYISPDKKEEGMDEDVSVFKVFNQQLKALAKRYPFTENGEEDEKCQ